MAMDPYQTLGVPRTANADEIRRAYRKLAKQSHPDLHPGDKSAEERFKSINTAHDILSDPDRRGRFDRGEIDAAGDPRYSPPPGYARHAQGPQGFKYAASGAGPFGEAEGTEYQDVFAEFLNQSGANPRRQSGPRRGADRAYTLEVEFLEAVNGGSQRLSMPDGATLDVRIPPGIDTGQTLRLKHKGEAGRNGGEAGDALIEIIVRPHPNFTREGSDLTVEYPITLTEAILGAKVPVPTTTGSVMLSIPPNSANGARLRLRGRGIPARPGRAPGDLYVTLKLVLDPGDSGLARFLRERTDAPAFDPRTALKETTGRGQ